jgi:hypothetical protein
MFETALFNKVKYILAYIVGFIKEGINEHKWE